MGTQKKLNKLWVPCFMRKFSEDVLFLYGTIYRDGSFAARLMRRECNALALSLTRLVLLRNATRDYMNHSHKRKITL